MSKGSPFPTYKSRLRRSTPGDENEDDNNDGDDDYDDDSDDHVSDVNYGHDDNIDDNHELVKMTTLMMTVT